MHFQGGLVATKVDKDTAPARYAVMGNPVAHSKSPVIHKQFAHQFGHDIEYTAFWVDTDGFAEAAEQFRAEGGKGSILVLARCVVTWSRCLVRLTAMSIRGCNHLCRCGSVMSNIWRRVVCWLKGHDWESESYGVSWCARWEARDIDDAVRQDLRR